MIDEKTTERIVAEAEKAVGGGVETDVAEDAEAPDTSGAPEEGADGFAIPEDRGCDGSRLEWRCYLEQTCTPPTVTQEKEGAAFEANVEYMPKACALVAPLFDQDTFMRKIAAMARGMLDEYRKARITFLQGEVVRHKANVEVLTREANTRTREAVNALSTFAREADDRIAAVRKEGAQAVARAKAGKPPQKKVPEMKNEKPSKHVGKARREPTKPAPKHVDKAGREITDRHAAARKVQGQYLGRLRKLRFAGRTKDVERVKRHVKFAGVENAVTLADQLIAKSAKRAK